MSTKPDKKKLARHAMLVRAIISELDIHSMDVDDLNEAVQVLGRILASTLDELSKEQ